MSARRNWPAQLVPFRLSAFAALLTAMLACLGAIAPASASSSGGPNCRDRTVLDFSAPLRGMQPPSHGPAAGSLPFLPGGLQLDHFGSKVGVGPTQVGFVLSSGGEGRGKESSGWEAWSTLTAVRAGGAALRIVGKKRQTLNRVTSGSVDSLRLGVFSLPAREAFYRLNVVFRNGSESHSYREYYRVLPRRVDLRLALSSAVLAPGEKLSWRLENFGTLQVSHGLEYSIERLSNSRWVVDPITPSGFPGVGFSMGAGDASRCQSLQLPAQISPGLYRLSKDAEVGGRERRVVSEFTVVG